MSPRLCGSLCWRRQRILLRGADANMEREGMREHPSLNSANAWEQGPKCGGQGPYGTRR
jgi:hypothetical protein